jgi:hypothetical protein
VAKPAQHRRKKKKNEVFRSFRKSKPNCYSSRQICWENCPAKPSRPKGDSGTHRAMFLIIGFSGGSFDRCRRSVSTAGWGLPVIGEVLTPSRRMASRPTGLVIDESALCNQASTTENGKTRCVPLRQKDPRPGCTDRPAVNFGLPAASRGWVESYFPQVGRARQNQRSKRMVLSTTTKMP